MTRSPVILATAALLACAASSAGERRWSGANDESAPMDAVSSWTPAPASMADVAGDTLILDKGLDKVASLGAGRSIKADILHVGYGGGAGRLEVADGSLDLAHFRLGSGSGSTGKAVVSGANAKVYASYATFLGDDGDAELTISGGELHSQFALQFGNDRHGGNTAVLNLDGGTLKTAQVNAHGSPVATFNWNGGTLYHSGNDFDGGIFPANESITVNVLAGGAVYKSNKTEPFNHPLSGEGSFTCRLGDRYVLTLAGATDLKGGFRVESGRLVLANLVRTTFKELSVAEGASLDLCGAEVTVASYVHGGVPMPYGTYEAHGGIVHVDDAVARPAVLAKAAAWYDPSDVATLTFTDGKVSSIANKGTAGSALDLRLRDAGKGGAGLSTLAFFGKHSLEFASSSGYRSAGYFPDGTPASGPRTLFVVAQGSSVGFLSMAQASWSEEGRSLILADRDSGFGSAYQVGRWNGKDWEKAQAKFSCSFTEPRLFYGRTTPLSGGTNVVVSCVMDADGLVNGETKQFYMPEGDGRARFKIYYGTFELPGGPAWDTDGFQGESLVFTNSLSDAEVAEVSAYLRARWLGPQTQAVEFEKLVSSGEVDLGGATWAANEISGDGVFVNGTVVLRGGLNVTVNADWSVEVPTFDKLVLGPDARLVVHGVRHLPVDYKINILPFGTLHGTFASIAGEAGEMISAIYEDDHVCARRDAGTLIRLR